MNWFGYSLFATIAFVIYDLLGRKLSQNSRNPVVFSGIYYIIASVVALSFYLFYPKELFTQTLTFSMILLTIFTLVVWSAFARYEYLAKKENEISEFLIITKFAPIVTLIISAIFLQEEITIFKVLAIVLIIFANGLIVIGSNFRITLDKGFVYSLLTATSLGIAMVMDNIASVWYVLPFFTFLSFFIPGIINLTVPFKNIGDIGAEIRNTNFLHTSILALVNVFGYLFTLIALAKAQNEPTKVFLVTSSASILTVIFAILLLHEKSNITKKIIAGILVVVATILLI